jgi:hypothetical protein
MTWSFCLVLIQEGEKPNGHDFENQVNFDKIKHLLESFKKKGERERERERERELTTIPLLKFVVIHRVHHLIARG